MGSIVGKSKKSKNGNDDGGSKSKAKKTKSGLPPTILDKKFQKKIVVLGAPGVGKTKMCKDFKSKCEFTNDKANVIKGVVMTGTSVVCNDDNT